MTLHTKISYLKSVLRIAGYILLLGDGRSVLYGVFLLVGAEILGIVEELPGAYKGTKTE